MKFIKESVLVTILFLIAFCSGNAAEKDIVAKLEDHLKIAITMPDLEKAGFQHFDASNFDLLSVGDNLYILNSKDRLIVKFVRGKPEKKFKSMKGQAPKEMVVPRSLFLFDQSTIAVYDVTRKYVLFFDLDVNYKGEGRIKSNFTGLANVSGQLLGFFNYKREHVYAVLDINFNIVSGFVKAHQKAPFKNFYPQLLNMGYFLDDNFVAHTNRIYPNKQCKVDIYDVDSKKLSVSLEWEQPHSMTEQDFTSISNLSFSTYVGRHDEYYVVQNGYSKEKSSHSQYSILVFNSTGELQFKGDFPYLIMSHQKQNNDSRLYFIDENENIGFIDVRDIVGNE